MDEEYKTKLFFENRFMFLISLMLLFQVIETDWEKNGDSEFE